MELREDALVVSKGLSELDRDVAEFTEILEECDISYVIVSGYVAILTGRSRSTEDIDVIIEPLSKTETERLTETLKNRGYWGMAMPLDSMYDMLSGGDRIRIAEEGELIPNFDVWFADSDLEWSVLDDPLSAESTVKRSPSAQSNAKLRTSSTLHRGLTASRGRISRMHSTSTQRSRNNLIGRS